VETIYWVRTR